MSSPKAEKRHRQVSFGQSCQEKHRFKCLTNGTFRKPSGWCDSNSQRLLIHSGHPQALISCICTLAPFALPLAYSMCRSTLERSASLVWPMDWVRTDYLECRKDRSNDECTECSETLERPGQPKSHGPTNIRPQVAKWIPFDLDRKPSEFTLSVMHDIKKIKKKKYKNDKEKMILLFRNFEMVSNWGMLFSRYPQYRIKSAKFSLYTRQACFSYSLVSSLNITPHVRVSSSVYSMRGIGSGLKTRTSQQNNRIKRLLFWSHAIRLNETAWWNDAMMTKNAEERRGRSGNGEALEEVKIIMEIMTLEKCEKST